MEIMNLDKEHMDSLPSKQIMNLDNEHWDSGTSIIQIIKLLSFDLCLYLTCSVW